MYVVHGQVQTFLGISDVLNVRLTVPFVFRNMPLFAAVRAVGAAVGLSGCFLRGENGRNVDVGHT